jgi:hypothetical protein
MADARVTATHAEVMVQGATPPVRVSAVHAEVIFVGDPPPARVTAMSVEVMFLASTEISVNVTSAFLEVLQRNVAPPDTVVVTSLYGELAWPVAAAESVEMTEVRVDALVVNPLERPVDPDAPDELIGIRSSQLAAEVLGVSTEDGMRVSQLAAEVLLVAEFNPCIDGPAIGCTTIPVAYRLRIRNADDTANDLVVTSLGYGTDSLIAEVPRIDGATFDPLTGKTTIGQANVLVIDAAAGAPDGVPDGTDRPVTKILIDPIGRNALLGRKAFLELAGNCDDPTFGPHFAGYVTALNLADAMTWEITIAHTSRDDERRLVWSQSTDSYITARSYLMGGPVSAPVPSSNTSVVKSQNEGFWQARVIGVYDTFVHFDVDEDNSGAFPPSDLKGVLEDVSWIRASNNDAQRNVFRWVNGNFQKYFQKGYPTPAAEVEWNANPTGKNPIRGYAPRVAVQFLLKNGSMINHAAPLMASYERRYTTVAGAEVVEPSRLSENLGNHLYVNWADTDAVAQPAVNDVLTFFARPLDVSPAAPAWVVDHPANILRDALQLVGYTVNSSSVTQAITDLGAMQYALRITDPPKLSELLQELGGLFGLGVRPEPNGTRTIFCWRTRRTPVATITLDDLPDRAPTIWQTDEASQVFSVSWEFQRFDRWPGPDQEANKDDRALDGIMAFPEVPVVFQTGDVEPIGSRTQAFKSNGMVMTSAGANIASVADLVAPWAEVMLDVFGSGSVTTVVNVLHTVIADLGDEVLVDLPQRPGFDIALTPKSQRGLPERALVVGRTPYSWGDQLTLLRLPEIGSTTVPVAAVDSTSDTLDDTNVASAFSSTTVRLTLTDDTDWAGSGVLIGVQYVVQATEPTGDGLTWPSVWEPTPGTFDLTGFAPGQTVWVRTRVETPDSGAVGSWSAWQSVTLPATTSTTVPGLVQRPAVTFTVSGGGVVDLATTVGAEIVKVYAAGSTAGFPATATILAGSTDTTAPFSFASLLTLTSGQTGYCGVIGEDAAGNRSLPTYVSAPFGATSAAPVDAQYLTLALNGALTNERRLVAGTGLTGTDAGAGADYTLEVAATVLSDLSGVISDLSTHEGLTSGAHGISVFGATLVDDVDAAAARTTLGLGTAATSATGDFDAAGAAAAVRSSMQDVAVGIVIDGGGAVLTTGVKGDVRVPFACTILDWTLLADQSGSVVVDIWKDTYANYPPVVGDSITAAAKPTITTATKNTSSTLTGWTTAIAAGDTIRFNVDSVTTIQRVSLILTVRRT